MTKDQAIEKAKEQYDRELAIEDLAFSSTPKNDKAIMYAIECIDKLAKIKQIVKDYDGSQASMIKQFSEIQKVLEQE